MKHFVRLNNALGWLVFLISTTVYIITSEPTASFWDCGEYISTAYKLQVGHPPGAPLFQMAGRFFSLFAFGDVTLVARMVNTMSAIASGFTILFLFWTITALTKKIFEKKEEGLINGNIILILGSGLIGSMAYTFSDSFWFSAVEGEVYATSSFFTAIVFWAILKWERVADEPYGLKWLIFIGFLMGLSIGVHLLNLLAIPAITMVYYFRKWKNPNLKGAAIAMILSFLILAFIMNGIIPEVVNLFAHSEIIFVNGLGLPFNTGTVLFALLIAGVLITGVRATYVTTKNRLISFYIFSALLVLLVLSASSSTGNFFLRLIVIACLVLLTMRLKNNKPDLNAILLSLSFLLIGYSSFFMLVIRSNSGTPINENSPKDAIGLLSYLNREQYGDWPVFYGNYYNAPLDAQNPYLDGNSVYRKDNTSGKYVILESGEKTIPNYDKKYCTIFPRMWSQQQNHISEYQSWAGIKNDPEAKRIPTFGENLRYFFMYQVGHMYLRYFMWNFAGKQNDVQGHGGILDGNWQSGIKWLDEGRLGPQSNLPYSMANNRANNKFYLIPLILGFIGFFFHLNNHSRDTLVVGLLFFMTGIAIIVYLNQYPLQPRERDYSYAASFYAFAIWIGLAVPGIAKYLSKKLKPVIASTIALILCCSAPLIMASEGWNDHDRSGRYSALEMAENYLKSCKPNAILFTVGDNDTFPLWYAQEVEGIRTDVRVVNLSLLSMDWYIDQMRIKVYDSPALPISIPKDSYQGSKRELVWFYENPDIIPSGKYADIRDMLKFALSDNPSNKLSTKSGKLVDYFPTSSFCLPVDKKSVIKYGAVDKQQVDSIADSLKWTVPDYGLAKSHLVLLDIIANNNWERPLYFSATTGTDEYMGLNDYLHLEGYTFRLLPVKKSKPDDEAGQVNSTELYKNLIENYNFNSFKNPHVYIDETNLRITYGLKQIFYRLSSALIEEGKKDSAVKAIDKCMEIMPEEKVPFDFYTVLLNDNYYYAGNISKGNKLSEQLLNSFGRSLAYYFSFDRSKARLVENEKKMTLALVKHIEQITEEFGQKELNKRAAEMFNLYAKM